MQNLKFKIIFSFIFIPNILYNMSDINSSKQNIDLEAQKILKIKKIDLDRKSIKGWIRVINSKRKLLRFDIELNYQEREILLKYLHKLKDLEQKKNTKEIR